MSFVLVSEVESLCDCELEPVPLDEELEKPLPCEMNVAEPVAFELPEAPPVMIVPAEPVTVV